MKRTIYIQARISTSEFNVGEVEYNIWEYELKGEGWTTLEKREIDIREVSRDDLVPDAIKALQEEQQKLRAEAEVKVQALQNKIDKLLAIEVTR